jgi:pimeloyl-ACP methyl ester carboxylesterase
MKTVLFVPGYQEDLTSRDYAATIKAIEKRGYSVKFVPIQWTRTTIKDWTKELDEVFSSYDPAQTILAGFSFGAMTAFMSAAKRNPSQLWLFSLSPYFAEDLNSKNMKATWLKGIGHRRVHAFSELHFHELAQSIECKTLLFAGQLEIDKWPVIGERVADAHRHLKPNELTIIQGAGHDVANEFYIQAIAEAT